MEGFKEVVQEAWNKPMQSQQPLKRLHIKMARTAKAIKRWKKNKNWRHKTTASNS